MSEMVELQHAIAKSQKIASVIKIMKVMALTKVQEFEKALNSSEEYLSTIAQGLHLCLKESSVQENKTATSLLLVFGTNQGFVGSCNDSLIEKMSSSFDQTIIFGTRLAMMASERNILFHAMYPMPSKVESIATSVQKILQEIDTTLSLNPFLTIYILYNQPSHAGTHQVRCIRLFPFEEEFIQSISHASWKTKEIPAVIGEYKAVFSHLVREYLFSMLSKGMLASLFSENVCRAQVMQQAEKKIEEMLKEMSYTFQRHRQNSIDDELFDLLSGYFSV